MSTGMVIIGAGHAGVRAALAIREAGYDGPVSLIAEEGSDLPYERPPLSKWSGDEPGAPIPVIPSGQLDDAQIDRIDGKVIGISAGDKVVLMSDGTTHPYAKLLLATGAAARRLPESLAGQSPVLYLRDLADAQRIRQLAAQSSSAVIIGGGFIGLELAASLRGAGLTVQVLEAANALLARAVSAEVANIVHQLHVEHGVQFVFNANIVEFSMSDGHIRLDPDEQIKFDMIIAGVGSVPVTELADSAGLEVSNGVVVDSHLRSSNPDIYAAGDCCSFPLYGTDGQATRLESWQAAGDQGALAGLNMVTDTPGTYTSVPWFWSEQYDHVLQVAGLPTPDMTFVQRAYGSTHHVTFGLNPDGSLGYACGIADGLKVAKDIRFAMKLIEKARPIDKEALANPETALKTLR